MGAPVPQGKHRPEMRATESGGRNRRFIFFFFPAFCQLSDVALHNSSN